MKNSDKIIKNNLAQNKRSVCERNSQQNSSCKVRNARRLLVKPYIKKFSGEKFAKEYVQKQHAFRSTTLDKRRNFYQPPNQKVRKIREEETESEKNNSFGMTMHESSNFKDMWSFNHPHLNVKEHRKKLS